MQSTLTELSTLISQWNNLRKHRPTENDFSTFGYPNLKTENIDEIFNTWKQNLETAISRTHVVDQLEETIIDAATSKLIREIQQNTNNAINNGIGWLISSTNFLQNIVSITAYLSAPFAKRIAIRKDLLKIASSTLNNDISSVEKAAPTAQEIIKNFEKIQQQKATIDELVESVEGIKDQADEAKQSALANQAAVAELLVKATEHQDKLKEQADTLLGLIGSAQEKLDEIEKQKSDADKKIASSAESVSKANEQLSKAIQDINKQELAGAFAKRMVHVSGERILWLGMFLLSIAGLIIVGLFVIKNMSMNGNISTFDLNAFMHGLPFAAPAIWLGWFSARQISILSRIQEDYAYKASTAVAFEGYKKEVVSADDNELLKKLLETAITNFGANPVRLYDGKIQDHGHPIEALIEKVLTSDEKNNFFQKYLNRYSKNHSP